MSDWISTISSPLGAVLIPAILCLTYIGLRVGRMYNIATMTLASGLFCGLIPMGWLVLVCALLPFAAPLVLLVAFVTLFVSPGLLIFSSELAAIGGLLGAAVSGIGYTMSRL